MAAKRRKLNSSVEVEEEIAMVDASEFPLEWLPTEVLAGVLQRVRPDSRWQAELVDQQLAATARTHAWRHTHLLDVATGGATVQAVSYRCGRVVVSLKALDSVAAARAVIERARFTHVRFSFYSLDEEQLTQLNAVVVALAESPRVRLRSVHLDETQYPRPDRSSEELVQLIERHANTLNKAFVCFADPDMMGDAAAVCPNVYTALGACDGLNQVHAWVYSLYSHEQLAVVLQGKRLRSLQVDAVAAQVELDTQIFLDLPSPSTLEVLHLECVRLDVAYLLDTKPQVFAKLRRFEAAHLCSLGDRPVLMDLLTACPVLEVLNVDELDSESELCDEASVAALPRAYFAVADAEHSLFARLPVLAETTARNGLLALVAAWQADVAGLRVDCFDEAVRAAAALPAPVGEAPRFPRKPQFGVRLEGGKRRLFLALDFYGADSDESDDSE